MENVDKLQAGSESAPYVMKISRTTIDKLGIKLYDNASAVVGELVANSYDADAEHVVVKIPLNRWLATRSGKNVVDQGLEIIVEDDGIGMTPEEINEFFLKVGTDPRADVRRGPVSKEKKRPRMGRKGVGKLAPFGICRIIEVKSAGGKKMAGGYFTGHLTMDFDRILKETDEPYEPKPGECDRTYSKERGTAIKLRNFICRRTADPETFHRQIARRFGPELPDFKIEILDTETSKSFLIGGLSVEIDEDTKIVLDERPVTLEDETKLPVRGWVAYAKNPYSNVEIAGIRIYARGRLASCTRDFGLKAGFTGEFTIRSYLVGIIHADWLDSDDGEDLIQSGRQDVLWDSEVGSAFRNWGQQLIKELGEKSWSPVRERTWKIFFEESKLEEEAGKRFKDPTVIESALQVGKMIGRGADRDAIQKRPEYVEALRDLVLTIAPHKMIIDKLKEVEESIDSQSLDVVAKLFNDAKLAESASLGMIVKRRVNNILKLKSILPSADEHALQKVLEGATWIIDPRWTMLQADRTFKSLREKFEQWWEDKFNVKITTTTEGDSAKRPDFIMLHVGRNVEIVEIKRKGHQLNNKEFEKIQEYYDGVDEYLRNNPMFQEHFRKAHITLVCDDVNLDKTHRRAYDSLEKDGNLKKMTWDELLLDTETVNKDFLEVSMYSAQ